MTPQCGATSKGKRCTLDAGHDELGRHHRDADGESWAAHVPAPGGTCVVVSVPA